MQPYIEAFGMRARTSVGPDYSEGSLWGEQSRFNTPFEELPAPEFDIGDVIVVQFKENFRSQEDIRYQNDVESDVSFSLTNLWSQDLDKDIFGKIPGGTSIDYPKGNFKGEDNYDAETRGQRRSQLTIDIPCTVTKILPDGRLLIEGRQSRIIGRDKKNRVLSGVVDPEDVDPVLRSVPSTRVADSQMRWEGKGPGENVTNPGLVHKILDYLPLF
jgi:flagellar basal body L-ring protein FlgH